MTLAFDIDGTWDRDVDLWLAFYWTAIKRGHHCLFVTGAEQPAEKLARLRLPENAPVIVARGELKETAARRAGYRVDVWIDDMPGMIQECHILGGEIS